MAVTAKTLDEASFEPRWPAILVMLLAVVMLTSLPARYQAAPAWLPWTTLAVVVTPMIALALRPSSVLWHRIERTVVLIFVVALFSAEAFMLLRLLGDMISPEHEFASLTLLEEAVIIWIFNILTFTLLYWQVDRGGPEARALDKAGPPDIVFAESEGEHGENWAPYFVDYLFLAFATSTSFTPPDYCKPASRRMKLCVMAQASLSLATLVLVASRAVATLS